MARNLLNLKNDIASYRKKLNSANNERSIEVAMAIVRELVRVTPVDTSKAVSNWQIGLGSPISESDVIEPHVPGVLGYTAAASGRVTIKEAERMLRGKKPGQTVYVGNGVDYIEELNEGSSRQEPAGFVERAELLGRKTQESIPLKVK